MAIIANPAREQLHAAPTGKLSNQWFARRGVDPLTAAKIPVVAGVMGMARFTVRTSEVANQEWAIACLSVAMFLDGVSTRR